MTTTRLPFIDWMKCLGMAAIVFWHIASYGINDIPPIYPKQLGVTFFLFVAGFSLAREQRSAAQVVFNRLFEIYLFGIGCALLMSAVRFATLGVVNGSNYLPFMLGINVVFNNFPANPTTWYIGTYIHAILVWALLLRRIRVRPWMLVASCLVEVAIRALLIQTSGLFVAYMALPNWATVFLLGYYYGQNKSEVTIQESPMPWLAVLALALGLWWLVASPRVSSYTFPFMTMAAGSEAWSLLAGSAAASLIYIGLTWQTFQITRRLQRSATVEFLARNTLIIFLAHMPLYYWLVGPLDRWTGSVFARVVILSILCFPALAGISELIVKLVQPRALREWLWSRIQLPAPIHQEPVVGTSSVQG